MAFGVTYNSASFSATRPRSKPNSRGVR